MHICAPPLTCHQPSTTAWDKSPPLTGSLLSTLISELATSAFNREYPQAETETSTVTGLPQLPLGHPVSSQDVAAFLAEEEKTRRHIAIV